MSYDQTTQWFPGAGIPLAPPVVHRRQRPSMQVSGESGRITGTNTPATSSPEPPRPDRRVTARALSKLADQMPLRDRHVLQRIAAHRFLSTDQVRRFEFTNHASQESASRTARLVLGRLEKGGLIRALARRVGGFRAGSTAKIWQLAPAGARLLAGDSDFRGSEPSPRFLLHCMAIADVHLELLDLKRDVAVTKVAVETEPTCWRRYVGLGGESLWLQPDLAATVYLTEYIDRWFIEVDLGTESLPTVLKKCERYEAHRQSGQEEVRQQYYPRVLWLMSDARRAERLQRAIDGAARLTPSLYRICTPDTLGALLRSGG